MTDVCPECGELGVEDQPGTATYKCPNRSCWVDQFDGKRLERMQYVASEDAQDVRDDINEMVGIGQGSQYPGWFNGKELEAIAEYIQEKKDE